MRNKKCEMRNELPDEMREKRCPPLTQNPELRTSLRVARLRCRLDLVIGRQCRASQVAGEERLNLAAQCVLNLIG